MKIKRRAFSFAVRRQLLAKRERGLVARSVGQKDARPAAREAAADLAAKSAAAADDQRRAAWTGCHVVSSWRSAPPELPPRRDATCRRGGSHRAMRFPASRHERFSVTPIPSAATACPD